MIQQQGKRCRWSQSLVSSDHLFISLHKHNHLLHNTWYVWNRAQLFFNVSWKSYNSLQPTATTTSLLPSSFLLAHWQASFRRTSWKKKTQNKILPGNWQYHKPGKVDKNDYNFLPLSPLLVTSFSLPSLPFICSPISLFPKYPKKRALWDAA